MTTIYGMSRLTLSLASLLALSCGGRRPDGSLQPGSGGGSVARDAATEAGQTGSGGAPSGSGGVGNVPVEDASADTLDGGPTDSAAEAAADGAASLLCSGSGTTTGILQGAAGVEVSTGLPSTSMVVSAVEVQATVRLVLRPAGGGDDLTLDTTLTALPDGVIKVGDVLNLRYDVAVANILISRTRRVTLSRQGAPLLIVASEGTLPDLGNGIAITQGAKIASCSLNAVVVICYSDHYLARVEYQGQSVTMAPGESATLANLRLRLTHYSLRGSTMSNCDNTGLVTIAVLIQP